MGPTGYLSAALYRIGADANLEELALTTVNLLHAHGDEDPRPLTPGTPMTVGTKMHRVDAGLAAGDLLALREWQWWDASRTYNERADAAHDLTSVAPEPVILRYGEGTESSLRTPILDPTSLSFFDPPMPPGV